MLINVLVRIFIFGVFNQLQVPIYVYVHEFERTGMSTHTILTSTPRLSR